MREAVSDILAERAKDAGGIGRLLGYSFATHLAVVVALAVMPPDWLSSQAPKVEVMIVSLGGATGPRSTGVAPIAGQRVDQVLPETTRPVPLKPAPPPKPDTMPTPSKAAPARPVAKPPEKPPATTSAATTTRPPVTGARVQSGTAVADTGSAGVNQGLTIGGGSGAGGEVDLNNFYPEWTAKFKDAINRTWDRIQPEVGFAVIRVTIRRDGTIVEALPQVVESSGSFGLEQVSRRALLAATLPPLPAEYKESTLVVRLRFDYER